MDLFVDQAMHMDKIGLITTEETARVKEMNEELLIIT
jgi:hypothetical protein